MELNQKMNTPLSDTDLEKGLGIPANGIMKYSELSNFKSIDELLPSVGSFKVILIEDKWNSGHWVGLVRGKNEYLFFNSYGCKYDSDWKFVPRMMRMILGEGTNELTRLLRDVPNDWNRTKLQGTKTQTCGRWVILFCSICGMMGYDMREFNRFLALRKKENPKMSYDQICVKMTENI